MSKIIKNIGIVVIAIVLALGWTWTDVLLQRKYIDDTQRVQILIGLTVLLALQQIYLVLPKPAKKGTIESRKLIIEKELTNLLEAYYKIYESRRPKKKPPIIRINIMLPTKRWRGLFGTYLKIYYYRCPDKVIYTTEEFSLKWKKGEGTCGAAWKINKPTVFDSVNPELKLPANSIGKAKEQILKSIKCTLSIPVWLDKGVVGVLNLDSKQNIKDTLFLDNNVLVRVSASAVILSGLFYEDGVEG